MNSYALASHYSKALFHLSVSQKQLEKHSHELESFQNLLKNNVQLEKFLLTPSIAKEKKTRVLNHLFQDKIDQTLLNFLLLLIDKERFKYLPVIIKEYFKLAKKELGVLVVQIITAVPMDDKARQEVRSKIEHSYHQKAEIKESVDPRILGGMILILDHQMIDRSVRNQLGQLKEKLLEAKI